MQGEIYAGLLFFCVYTTLLPFEVTCTLFFKILLIIAVVVNCVGNVCITVYHYSIGSAPILIGELFISMSLIAGAFMLSAFGKLKE